jgi:prephenate dehydratase
MINQLSYISESFKDLSKEFTRFVLISDEKGSKERENRKQDAEKEY